MVSRESPTPIYRWVCLGVLFLSGLMMQGLRALPYLMDVHGLMQRDAANMLTLWAIGLIVGCALWGYVADRVLKTRKGVICGGAVVYAFLGFC
jgi:sugar phosphate permease